MPTLQALTDSEVTITMSYGEWSALRRVAQERISPELQRRGERAANLYQALLPLAVRALSKIAIALSDHRVAFGAERPPSAD